MEQLPVKCYVTAIVLAPLVLTVVKTTTHFWFSNGNPCYEFHKQTKFELKLISVLAFLIFADPLTRHSIFEIVILWVAVGPSLV